MPDNNSLFEIAIVGSGAAGSMGALRAVLNNLDTVCFMGSPKTKRKARATWVGKVENMPVLFDKPKAIFSSAREVFGWIRAHETWKEKLTEVADAVESIEGKKGDFTLKTSKGGVYKAKHVVLCTGIMDVQPEIQGDIRNVYPFANEGHVEYCIRCDGHKTKGNPTAIIGHQEVAGWIASLLIERYDCPKMAVVTNGKPFEMAEDSALKERLDCYGIEIHEEPIAKLLGEPKGKGLTGIELEGGKIVDCRIAFVSLGAIVYNGLAKSLGCEVDERGYVVTDKKGESNVPGIFAGGDLRANTKKQIYTSWDVTVDAVDKIDAYVREERRTRRISGCRVDAKELSGALMG